MAARLSQAPPEALPNSIFSIDEQEILLALARFFAKADHFSFSQDLDWERQIVWSSSLRDWYLVDWD